MTVHRTSNRFLSVRIGYHRYLYDKTRQTLDAPRTRHIRHRRRSKDTSGGVQGAIRSRAQVKAGIWDRRGRRALRQKVALPTTPVASTGSVIAESMAEIRFCGPSIVMLAGSDATLVMPYPATKLPMTRGCTAMVRVALWLNSMCIWEGITRVTVDRGARAPGEVQCRRCVRPA